MNHVPLVLGYAPQRAEVQNGEVHLHVCGRDGSERELVADHIIAATGYKVDLKRLSFLSSQIRSQVRTVENTPVLASTCESSLAGLYFVGISAANSFGPVMRFAFGADFAARTVTRAIAKTLSRIPETVLVQEPVLTK